MSRPKCAYGPRCKGCGSAVTTSEIMGEETALDVGLLAKLASGEGGKRTGALKRAGYLKWTVTPDGLKWLATMTRRKP